MKKINILYWVFTSMIVLFDGLLPALTFNSELARQGIAHLGYPDYFRVMLTFFKVAGALVLILPVFKYTIKQWAYAGFTFNFTSAAISTIVVDDLTHALLPIFALAILAVSYYCYQRRTKLQTAYTAPGHPKHSTALTDRASAQKAQAPGF